MKKSQFQFTDPVLTKLIFSLNPEFRPESDGVVSLVTSFQTKISAPENPKDPALVALEVSIRGEEENNSPFKIEAEMAGQFTWLGENVAEAYMEKLLEQNASALLLGYLRPIVAFATMQAGLRPYQIPFMNFAGEEREEE